MLEIDIVNEKCQVLASLTVGELKGVKLKKGLMLIARQTPNKQDDAEFDNTLAAGEIREKVEAIAHP